MRSVLLQDGDWKLVGGYSSQGYDITHNCPEGAPKYAQAWVGRVSGVCGVCKTPPPEAMQGFITLMEWER